MNEELKDQLRELKISINYFGYDAKNINLVSKILDMVDKIETKIIEINNKPQ
jgi:hypothetical protein